LKQDIDALADLKDDFVLFLKKEPFYLQKGSLKTINAIIRSNSLFQKFQLAMALRRIFFQLFEKTLADKRSLIKKCIR